MALFQSFWNGKLGPLQRLCIQSFLDHGHDFDLYAFNQMANMPSRARTLDAGSIVKNKSWWRNHEQLRTFSNLFRFELLRQKGGWWVDTDVICLTDNIPNCERFFAWVDSEVVNVATVKMPIADPIMVECIKRWKENEDADKSGPALFTKLLNDLGITKEAQPFSTCNPIHWKQAGDVIDARCVNDLKNKIKNSMFLHLWETIFHWRKTDLVGRPPKGSLLAHFADKHGWLN